MYVLTTDIREIDQALTMVMEVPVVSREMAGIIVGRKGI